MGIFGKPNIEKKMFEIFAGKRNVDCLFGSLRHKDPDVRRQAALAIGVVWDCYMTFGLEFTARPYRFLLDKNRVEAMMIELLTGALEDKEPSVRTNAALVLGATRQLYVVSPLRRALGDRSSTVRKYVALALEAISDPRAVESLSEEIMYRSQREWPILDIRGRLEKELEENEVREAAKAASKKIRRKGKSNE